MCSLNAVLVRALKSTKSTLFGKLLSWQSAKTLTKVLGWTSEFMMAKLKCPIEIGKTLLPANILIFQKSKLIVV